MKIPVAKPTIGEEELENIISAVNSGWIGKGQFIKKFEREFADYNGCSYGVSTMNGTAAIHLALASLGIKKGDEVIVPDLTFAATAEAVSYCGAIPIFVDINEKYWCIEPSEIERKITDKTRAIIPVHLYGHPCDMDPIMKIAEEHNLYVIEDCAEAHGAEYKGRRVGSIGNVGCFSFYGNKVITTGEGGMCITNDEELAKKMEHYRSHCMKEPYYHTDVGFNYRMTNLQAAIGVAQLTKINQFIEKKKQIANWYKEGLEYLAEQGMLTLHPEMPWAKCVYWMYSILVRDKLEINRDNLIRFLAKRGIETRPFFYPMHILPPYKTCKGTFRVAESISSEGLNLPSSPTLEESQIEYIIEVVIDAFSKRVRE